MNRIILTLLCLVSSIHTEAQDSTVIKVHFIYGSKPDKHHKEEEPQWFGGIHGGHVGVEIEPGRVLNFNPCGSFHLVKQPANRHSRYSHHDTASFWELMGGNSADMKKLTVIIPVSHEQKLRLDSLSNAYRENTPYDYAFIGMRCGAAAYDVLAYVDIVAPYKTDKKTALNIFYPKILRKELLSLAPMRGWQLIRQEGSRRRKWERD